MIVFDRFIAEFREKGMMEQDQDLVNVSYNRFIERVVIYE